MGGDDLGSDDEYFDSSFQHNGSEALDEEPEPEQEYVGRRSRNKQLQQQKKRSRPEADETAGEGAHEGESDELPSTKKRSKKGGGGSQRNLLLESGRGIAEQTPDLQSAFLWTCFTHSLKMGGEDPEKESVEKFQPANFYSPPAPKKAPGKNGNKASGTTKAKSMATFLKGGALSSSKRLKKWKVNGSPMVIIVCLSARRAVAILKQLGPLNCRCAKLFAKHMDVQEQVEMLQSNSYGIAVGTPNRLLKLFETGGGEGGGSGGALRLDQTELLVIDNHEDHKSFTVCTLNDTAPDLMRFIRRAVTPQMQKRKTLKFAMF